MYTSSSLFSEKLKFYSISTVHYFFQFTRTRLITGLRFDDEPVNKLDNIRANLVEYLSDLAEH